MTRQRNRWRAVFTLGLALSLLSASACADDDDDASTDSGDDSGGGGDSGTVTLFGPEVEFEQQSLQDAFDAFTEDTGIEVEVNGSRSFETEVGPQVDAGNPPDIAMFPQPGKIKDFAGDIVPLPDDVLEVVGENIDEGWTSFSTIDGDVLAIPAKADLKSVVWYSPAAFQEGGYEIPESFDDFLALADTMLADGKTPFCVGIGSDDATGWPMTDWIEEFVLRLQGPEVYDQWVNHEIPFDDPAIVESAQAVYDLWATDGMVFGGLQNIGATPFAEAGLPLLEGDCLMHRQGNFYGSNFTDAGATLGADGDVNAFYLPGSEENPNITLSGGIYAAAFADRPEVMEVMSYIASPEFGNSRAGNEIGGYLSPNKNVDTSLYTTELDQTFGEILAAAEPVRFDASDLMPGAVGSGTFWSAAVDIVGGTKTVDEAFADVEASWPSD
ncbi:MAG TPA: ABC transporter substrate-binding protein [Acidimicrobiales bacterium]|nr:ABC transporter substrate-binding protein [Acidimicrobiales bacterium]